MQIPRLIIYEYLQRLGVPGLAGAALVLVANIAAIILVRMLGKNLTDKP